MDHDQLFKDLLTTFFAEFLELFFPKMAAELDRDSIEFMDKELSTDIGAGERHAVDLLARVRLHGQETFILIHVENQASAEPDFPRRMFRYFAMLDRKYDLPVFPIAIFSYDRPLIQADDTYSLALFDVPILSFQFQAIQLNRLNWRDFLKKPNPVASALMAKMKIEPEDRPRAKLECLRMMLTLKYDPARSGLISQFMDSYLKLTPAETIVYTEAAEVLSPSEKEIAMTFTNEWTEKGGRETGLRIVMRLLRKRFGELPEQITSRLNELPGDRLSELAEALLDFQTLNDAQVWLSNQTV